jgi:hypothetical protein
MSVPSSRGLTEQEVLELYGRPDAEAFTKILTWGDGWIRVKVGTRTAQRSGGTISWRYNNPGNLKWGDFARTQGAIGPGWGRHAVFPTREQGQLAKKRLLFNNPRFSTLPLLSAISEYAPADDDGAGVPSGGNRPSVYTNYICEKAGVTPSTILHDMSDEQRDLMLHAMQTFEGFKPGTVKWL